MKAGKNLAVCALLLSCASALRADVVISVNHNDNDNASADYSFEGVPTPSTNNLASGGVFTLTSGEMDSQSGGLRCLTGTNLPSGEDEPRRNFFFAAGTDGGILRLDLKAVTSVWEINAYSWHTGSRAPQVYSVYGAAGDVREFTASPRSQNEARSGGWKLIANVDSRTRYGIEGGQNGARIWDAAGKIGDYRYLLFVCSATETNDAFGNTFYSRIDVLDHRADLKGSDVISSPLFITNSPDGKYEISISTRFAPDMKEWAGTKLAPALIEWYPKIVEYLPGEGYAAPRRVKIIIRPGRGVADTAGTRVNAYTPWLKNEENRESVGALVHEMVHVVQQYGLAQRHTGAKRNPGWLVEGIADYFRWYHFEPQSHGADIKPGAANRARYDEGYRTTANFLNWVSIKYDANLAPKLNEAMREGKYDKGLWKEYTGKTLEELATEWKGDL